MALALEGSLHGILSGVRGRSWVGKPKIVESTVKETTGGRHRPGEREVGVADGKGGRMVRPPCPIADKSPAEASC